MNKVYFSPNITVIYQEAKPDYRPGCLETLLYLVGIVVVFGFMLGGMWR